MSVELREVSASSSMANVKVNDKAILASTALALKLPSPQHKTWTEQNANKKQSPPQTEAFTSNRRPGLNKLQTRSRAHLCGRPSQISI